MSTELTLQNGKQLTPQEEVEKAIQWCDDVKGRADEIVKDDLQSGVEHLQFAELLKVRQEQTRMDDLKKSVSFAILELKRSIGKALLDMGKKQNQNDRDAITLDDLGLDKNDSHRYQAMARAPEYVWQRAMNKTRVPTQTGVFDEIKRYTKIREVLTEVNGSVDGLEGYFTNGRDPVLLKEELTKKDELQSDPSYGLSPENDDIDYDYVGSTEKKDEPKNDVDLTNGDGVTVDLTGFTTRILELSPVVNDIHDEVKNAADGDRTVDLEQSAKLKEAITVVADKLTDIEDIIDGI